MKHHFLECSLLRSMRVANISHCIGNGSLSKVTASETFYLISSGLCLHVKLHLHVSVIHSPSSIEAAVVCLHVSISTVFSGCAQGGVHCTCWVILTALCILDMARLCDLLQLEQDHVGWWQSFSGFGGWHTEEEQVTAQVVGPSYKWKEEMAWNLLPSGQRQPDEVRGKIREYFQLTREHLTKFIIFLCFLAPCTLGNPLNIDCAFFMYAPINNNNNKSLYSASIWWTIHCAVQYNYTYFI